MSDPTTGSRSQRLDRALSVLMAQTPEIEAAAVVSFDGLPMASALPAGMDEDRVAAMSAALLSLGERAAQGLGRGELSQVYIEGETGTVYLVSADDEAVLVAVAARGAKAGLMLFEARRAAAAVADVLRVDEPVPAPVAAPAVFAPVAAPEPVLAPVAAVEPLLAPVASVEPVLQSVPSPPSYTAVPSYAAAPAQYATAAEPVLTAVPTAVPTAVAEPAQAEPAHAALAHPMEPPAAAPSSVSPLDAAWITTSYAPSASVMPSPVPGTGQHWS